MPWCEGCRRYLTAPTVTPDGSCPDCGRSLAVVAPEAPPRAPWHFKLLVVAAGGYLAMRGAQGVAWLIQQLR